MIASGNVLNEVFLPQVINPEGEGPKSTVVVMTDEGSKFKLKHKCL